MTVVSGRLRHEGSHSVQFVEKWLPGRTPRQAFGNALIALQNKAETPNLTAALTPPSGVDRGFATLLASQTPLHFPMRLH